MIQRTTTSQFTTQYLPPCRLLQNGRRFREPGENNAKVILFFFAYQVFGMNRSIFEYDHTTFRPLPPRSTGLCLLESLGIPLILSDTLLLLRKTKLSSSTVVGLLTVPPVSKSR